jgi:hypothetical protein
MFYCDECAKRNRWPDLIPVSYGPCEVCGRTRACYDVPSSALPEAKPEPVGDYVPRDVPGLDYVSPYSAERDHERP